MRTFLRLISMLAAVVLTVQCKPDNVDDSNLSVQLHKTSVDVAYGEEQQIPFSAKYYDGNVSVSASGLPEGVSLSGTFDKASGAGVLTVTSTADRDSENAVKVKFADNRTAVTADLTIRTHAKATAEISLDKDFAVIYPYPSNITTTVLYDISNFDAEDVTVVCPDGVTGTVVKSDERSGRIELTAGEGFGDSGEVIVKATNKDEEITRTLAVEKAYFSIDRTSYDVPAAGARFTVTVHANVGSSCKIENAPEGMVSITGEDGSYTLTISANTTQSARTAKVAFRDAAGFFEEGLVISQQSSAVVESDKVALQNIYKALNGPAWSVIVYDEDGRYLYGAEKYLSWENEENIDNWHAVDAYTSGTYSGKVFMLRFVDYNPDRRGVMPDDLGKLTMLREFRMSGSSVSGLPDNLGNLTRLTHFNIYDNPINIRLDTHEGLKGLFQNASGMNFFGMTNCGLYGSIPEWVGDMHEGVTDNIEHYTIGLYLNNLSGRVPDKVANSSGWKHKDYIDIDRDGYFEEITLGEEAMRMQGEHGSYALWIGEQPDNVKFVDDANGGHWEWIGENPYLDNSRYRKAYEIGEDPTRGALYFGTGCY